MTYNIGHEVLAAAEALEALSSIGLKPIATGGGCDYISFQPPGKDCIYLIEDKFGQRIDNMESQVNILMFFDEDWRAWLSVPFASMHEALPALHNDDFRKAMAVIAAEHHPDGIEGAVAALPYLDGLTEADLSWSGHYRTLAAALVHGLSGAETVTVCNGSKHSAEVSLLQSSLNAASGPAIFM